MQLRRFTGSSAPEALAAVRRELGGDAIILANRAVGGQVEIIATRTLDSLEDALDESTLRDEPSVRDLSSVQNMPSTRDMSSVQNEPSAPVEPSVPSVRPVDFRRLEETSSSASVATAALEGAPEPMSKPEPAPAPAAAASAEPRSFDEALQAQAQARQYQALQAREYEAISANGLAIGLNADATGERTMGAATGNGADAEHPVDRRLDEHPDTVELASDMPDRHYAPVVLQRDDGPHVTDVATPMPSSQAARRDSDIARQVVEELATLQQPIHDEIAALHEQLRLMQVNLWGQVAPVRSRMVRSLLRLGAGAELAVRTAERVEQDASDDAAFRQCLDILKCSIPVARDTSITRNGVTIVSGGPGEDRAIVIGKIATDRLRQDPDTSMVIIAMESDRIGALELLQTYGKLLGIPIVLARTASELDGLLDAFGHKDLVFVDHEVVPGASGGNDPGSLEKFAAANPGLDVRHLIVLPATLQSANADALIARCLRPGTSRCVVAGLEQSCRLAELFSPIIRHHLPVAYWSDNSQLQSPLTRADASVLVATAVAMGRRVATRIDEDMLYRLIQPAGAGMVRMPDAMAAVAAVSSSDGGSTAGGRSDDRIAQHNEGALLS